MNFNFVGIVLIIIAVIGIAVLYRKSEEKEPYLLYKLIGYTFLGLFMLDLNGLKLPLGFIIFLMFFRKSTVNNTLKRMAAYLGLLLFLMSVLIPIVETKVYEWPREVELQDTNFYSGSLVEELKNIEDHFDVRRNTFRVTHFQTVITAEGNYKELEFDLIDRQHPISSNYRVRLKEDEETLEVRRYKQSYDFRTMDFTSANRLFTNFDYISKSMLTEKGVAYFELRTDGNYSGYAVRGREKYEITSDGKKRIENKQLPVKGIIVDVCGGDNSYLEYNSIFECKKSEHFLLDMKEKEPELKESTILTIARKNSQDIDDWLEEHIGDDIAERVDGKYILKKDGLKERVTREEYSKALKETPKVEATYNEATNNWSVIVKNQYGEEPHIMEFELDGITRRIVDLQFR